MDTGKIPQRPQERVVDRTDAYRTGIQQIGQGLP